MLVPIPPILLQFLELQTQLSNIAKDVFGLLIPFLYVWNQIQGPRHYSTVSAHLSSSASLHPLSQSHARRLLPEIISPDEQNEHITTRYPFQLSMHALHPPPPNTWPLRTDICIQTSGST